MTHICIYSESAHKVEFSKEIKDGAVVSDEVTIAKGDEYMANDSLVDYEKARFEGECRCRGGDWKVWCEKTPFEWPKEAEKKAE